MSTETIADELEKAHRIIQIAMDFMPYHTRTLFYTELKRQGLDGIGVTRATERRAVLDRIKEETEQ